MQSMYWGNILRTDDDEIPFVEMLMIRSHNLSDNGIYSQLIFVGLGLYKFTNISLLDNCNFCTNFQKEGSTVIYIRFKCYSKSHFVKLKLNRNQLLILFIVICDKALTIYYTRSIV
jgi:hypothetical protein